MTSASEWVARSIGPILQGKISAERTFRPELRRYFAGVARNLSASNSIQPVIEHQYRRVVSRLLGVRMKTEDEERRELRDRVLALLALRAAAGARLIDQTTSRHIGDALRSAREELGAGVPDAIVEKVAGRVFRRLSAPRINNIATTETQAATEGARDMIARDIARQMRPVIEAGDQEAARLLAEVSGDYATYRAAELVDDVAPSEILLGLSAAMKMWKDMDDARVRPWHAEADGQMVPVAEPYVVKGELLMYPGDSSFGASVSNLARCRCISLWV